MGLRSAVAIAVACRLAAYDGRALVSQVLHGLTVADWLVLAALAIAGSVAAVAHFLRSKKGTEQTECAAAAPPARRRMTRPALREDTDAVSRELDACLERAHQGERRAPLALLGSLHAARAVKPQHVSRVLGGGDLALAKDALEFAKLAKVSLDNDAVVAVVSGLCESDAATALEVWRLVQEREYYLPAACLEQLLCASMRLRAYGDAERVFEQLKRVATPSGKAYASCIFARGGRGDVAGCLNLYDEVGAERPDDRSPAWNALLVSLVRNGCSGRAQQLYAEGRERMAVLPVASRALRM